MKFLFRKSKNNTAHIWNDEYEDTYCTMWSTGGLSGKYVDDHIIRSTTGGRNICGICKYKYPGEVAENKSCRNDQKSLQL